MDLIASGYFAVISASLDSLEKAVDGFLEVVRAQRSRDTQRVKTRLIREIQEQVVRQRNLGNF